MWLIWLLRPTRFARSARFPVALRLRLRNTFAFTGVWTDPEPTTFTST